MASITLLERRLEVAKLELQLAEAQAAAVSAAVAVAPAVPSKPIPKIVIIRRAPAAEAAANAAAPPVAVAPAASSTTWNANLFAVRERDGVSYKEAMDIASDERNAKLEPFAPGLGARIKAANEAKKAAIKAANKNPACPILKEQRLAAQRLYNKLLNERKEIESMM